MRKKKNLDLEESYNAGSVMRETSLKNPPLWKNQRLLVLGGVLVLIIQACHLNAGMLLDGNGLRIPDWIALVSKGSSRRIQYASF